MSDAIKIVEEEFASFNSKAQQPLPIDIQMAIDTLEARIKDRLMKETVEIDEKTIAERYASLIGTPDYPDCHFCPKDAEFEGWTGHGHCIRVFVCGEHKSKLRGAQEENCFDKGEQ